MCVEPLDRSGLFLLLLVLVNQIETEQKENGKCLHQKLYQGEKGKRVVEIDEASTIAIVSLFCRMCGSHIHEYY